MPKSSKFSYKHVEIKITPNETLCAFVNESFSKSLRIKRAEIVDENEHPPVSKVANVLWNWKFHSWGWMVT